MAAPGLARLLSPKSIAIVGASDRVGPGFNAWRALEALNYQGRIHLVNPNRASLLGQSTYGSLAAIPESVDAVFIAVPRDAVLDAAREAAGKGVGGITVLSSGFGEAGADGARAEQALQAIAREHGMAVCGPNCLGFLNLAGGSGLWGTSLPAELPRGPAAAVVQRVVIAFLEQLRKPREFVAAARRAATLGKPVIVVKSGRTERGREAVLAHTGAIAGPDDVVEAAFRAAGVIRARSLDEMLEFAVLVSTTTRRPTTRGVAILSPSGGEIALALDLAEPTGLELPAVPDAARDLASLLPDFAHAGNPLDLTWAGLYDPAIAQRCVEILGREPAIGSFVLLHDAPRGLGEQQATRYASLLKAPSSRAPSPPANRSPSSPISPSSRIRRTTRSRAARASHVCVAPRKVCSPSRVTCDGPRLPGSSRRH